MPKNLTKADFTQVDSQWIYAVDGFHLSVERNDKGEFRLVVHGTLEPIPPATAYPTEPEWERLLPVGDKFLSAYATAKEQTT